jgi:hypothetical protein
MMYELSPTPEKQEEALSIATCLSPKLQGIDRIKPIKHESMLTNAQSRSCDQYIKHKLCQVLYRVQSSTRFTCGLLVLSAKPGVQNYFGSQQIFHIYIRYRKIATKGTD